MSLRMNRIYRWGMRITRWSVLRREMWRILRRSRWFRVWIWVRWKVGVAWKRSRIIWSIRIRFHHRVLTQMKDINLWENQQTEKISELWIRNRWRVRLKLWRTDLEVWMEEWMNPGRIDMRNCRNLCNLYNQKIETIIQKRSPMKNNTVQNLTKNNLKTQTKKTQITKILKKTILKITNENSNNKKTSIPNFNSSKSDNNNWTTKGNKHNNCRSKPS